MRKLQMLGTLISLIEITQVSSQGFWLLLPTEELFLSFENFPWFKDVTIKELCEVEWPSEKHIYWPNLDIDLSIDSIRDPSAFPLQYKAKGLYDLRHTLHFIPDTYFTVLSIRRANLCHGMKVRRWMKSLNLCHVF